MGKRENRIEEEGKEKINEDREEFRSDVRGERSEENG